MKGKTNSYTSSEGGDVLTTGASDYCRKYNIYDIAGNICEWTEEISYFSGRASNNQYVNNRGGGAQDGGSDACTRHADNVIGYKHTTVGFRVVLYIK